MSTITHESILTIYVFKTLFSVFVGSINVLTPSILKLIENIFFFDNEIKHDVFILLVNLTGILLKLVHF